MQQVFVEKKIASGDIVRIDNEDLYHLRKVLRKDSSYTFRICDEKGDIYHCHLLDDDTCMIDEYLDENNELECDITCILSLIKSDKFELCLQKLTELGVKRIVPYEAARSVMKINDEKKLVRFRRIIREAAMQSHRNIIPEITMPCDLKNMKEYLSDHNYICYEAEKNIKDIQTGRSLTYIIGPEGGFETKEYEKILELGFESISLGKRILRAETAALYMTSIIAGKCQ
ncbi:MAG: 16S rRNA (uracil(1498)-N(3))-methyltransferase [Erysipelotrichaceae bacterium]|nr:16S rRNA (uracil(1498)-N(3))-methyltransferase [Erysipelotrichaceae bacterium]